jgi:hypothetical protein
MSLVRSLDVEFRQGGCVVDLAAILDSVVCPSINLLLPQPHGVEVRPDFIIVTPSKVRGNDC